MRKTIIATVAIATLLSYNLALAQSDYGGSGSSGSSDNSGSTSGNDNSSSATDTNSSPDSSVKSSVDLSSSSSGSSDSMQTESIHSVDLNVPGGTSGSDFFKENFDASSSMEVESEHGLTILKPHGSSTDETTLLGQNAEGMDVQTEHGVSYLIPHGEKRDTSLENNVSGKILLQVQANGEAWWIDPVTKARLFLGRPDDAFQIMRENGLGITNADLNKIPASDENKPSSSLGKELSGRILLQVQSKGEAWYVNPDNHKKDIIGRPQDAFNIMRGLGLGITDANLNMIRTKLGEVGNRKLEVALLADNNSGQSGVAEITEMGNQVKVEVVLSGAPAGSVEPSHIHLGNRPNLGAVKYPLNDVVNGVAETILNVTFDQLISERPLGINVHKSAAEIGVYVASGNL